MNIYKALKEYKQFIIAAIFFSILGTGVTFALPYVPTDQELDPTCAPGDTDCYVSIFPDQTSNTGKLLFTDGTDPAWASGVTWDSANTRLTINDQLKVGDDAPGVYVNVTPAFAVYDQDNINVEGYLSVFHSAVNGTTGVVHRYLNQRGTDPNAPSPILAGDYAYREQISSYGTGGGFLAGHSIREAIYITDSTTGNVPTILHSLRSGPAAVHTAINILPSGVTVGNSTAVTYASTALARLVVIGSGTTSSTNTVAFHNSTGTSNSLVVKDNGSIGVGMDTPSFQFHMQGSAPNVVLDRYDNTVTPPVFRGRKARGTTTVPLAVQAGDALVYLRGAGYDGSGFHDSGTIAMYAAENFTGTNNRGMYIGFLTNPIGGPAISDGYERMRITDAGNILIGTTSITSTRLAVVGAGSTSATYTAQFHNSTGTSNSLVVRDDGNVGIGTNSPTDILGVHSSSSFAGMYTQNTLSTGRAVTYSKNDLGKGAFLQMNGSAYTGTWAGVAAADAAIFNGGGSPAFTAFGISGLSGPVYFGYGTGTIPSITLETDYTVGIGTGADTLTGVKLGVVGAGTGTGTYTAQFHNSTGTNNALVIRDDGNVGIGTNAPISPLSISTANTGATLQLINTNTTQYAGIDFYESATMRATITHPNASASLFPSSLWIGTRTSEPIIFSTDAGNTERMRISPTTGYVGIADSSPSAPLDVGGQYGGYARFMRVATNVERIEFMTNNSALTNTASLFINPDSGNYMETVVGGNIDYFNQDGGTTIYSDVGLSVFGDILFSGTGNITSSYIGVTMRDNFFPVGGTDTYISNIINPTINQTGGASGITRGLLVAPSLTAAADFRAIETAAGKVIFTANEASNYTLSIANDGNATTRWGLLIQSGLDDHTAAGPSTLIAFQDGDGTAVGSITFGSSATAYNTTSDQRMKNLVNEQTISSLNILKDIKIHDFTWKDDTNNNLYTGVFAQELYEVYPFAVTKPVNDEDKWMVDYSKLTPIIIASVQELNTNLTSLDPTKPNSLASLIKEYLGDALNGLERLFVGEVRTNKLCVGAVCVTEDQFLQMMQNNGSEPESTSSEPVEENTEITDSEEIVEEVFTTDTEELPVEETEEIVDEAPIEEVSEEVIEITE